MAKPTPKELADIAGHLLLFKSPAPTLSMPTHDASNTAQNTAFKALQTDNRFKDLSFAIIQYGAGGTSKVFFHNEDVSWDIGSAGKLSIALAAVSLWTDFKAMRSAGLVPTNITNTKVDELLRHVWGTHTTAEIKKLMVSQQFPQPSRIFDMSANPVSIRGINVADFGDLSTRSNGGHASANALSTMSFGERLHLTIGLSDNRAARSCQGALGIGFINAVMAHLGLFTGKVPTGVGMRIAGSYSVKNDLSKKLPSGWRQPIDISRTKGRDSWRAAQTGIPYAATAKTLAALMIAIMTDKFLDAAASALFRDVLLWRADDGFALGDPAINGMDRAAAELSDPFAATDKRYAKIGIYKTNAEFVHVTKGAKQYSLIILGLYNKVPPNHWNVPAEALGYEVHKILKP